MLLVELSKKPDNKIGNWPGTVSHKRQRDKQEGVGVWVAEQQRGAERKKRGVERKRDCFVEKASAHKNQFWCNGTWSCDDVDVDVDDVVGE